MYRSRMNDLYVRNDWGLFMKVSFSHEAIEKSFSCWNLSWKNWTNVEKKR